MRINNVKVKETGVKLFRQGESTSNCLQFFLCMAEVATNIDQVRLLSKNGKAGAASAIDIYCVLHNMF